MRKNQKAFALMMFLMFAAFINSSPAQSEDADNPTPLSSGELKGSLGDEDKEQYYSFVAGPGKISVTADIKASEGVASMTLNFSTEKSADVLVMPLASHRGSKREVDSFNLDKRQTVVMKLASTGSYNGSYLIRLDGAVDFGTGDSTMPKNSTDDASSRKNSTGDFSADCLPKSGTLSFVMSDGTVKEINLKDIQKVSHKP